MAKVLYIKANPKNNKDSITFKISEAFVKEYKKLNPKDKVVRVDLYKENIDFLSGEDLESMEKDRDSVVKKYATEFMEADKYIFAAPFWNLSIPAVLKAYIDYVCYSGITFKYTETGSIGLLENKKAIYIVARGGTYSGDLEYLDFGKQYLSGVLNFMGIDDFNIIECENTGVLTGKALEKNVGDAVDKAREMAKEF